MLRRFDFQIIVTAILISLIGVVLIGSATHNKDNLNGLWQKQLLVLAVGAVLMILLAFLNYGLLLRFAMPLYIISVLMLIGLFVYGRIAGGARSWVDLGWITFQPSEFAKIAVILILARTFSHIEKRKLLLKDLLYPGALTAVPVLLIAAQPDLGTAITFVPLFMGMALVGGLRMRSVVALLLIGLVLVAFAWTFVLKDYQKQRVRSFLNPGNDPKQSGYQIQQSLIAIGSGGLFGKGLQLGSQSQLNFVPAQHTDFVFSVLGEEMGFVAVAFVLFLYGILFLRSLYSLKDVHEIVGIFIVVGVISYLSFQTVINVLMSIGLFPTTGVPLPFLSYGGSSLLTSMIAIGLVVSVNAHPRKG